MYSNSVNLGTASAPQTGRHKPRNPYRERAGRFLEKPETVANVKAYLEAHQQAYTPTEAEKVHDYYVSGFEFHATGKGLLSLPVDFGIHGKGAPDNRRLFRLGYEDAQEIKENEQNKKISAHCPGAFTRHRRA